MSQIIYELTSPRNLGLKEIEIDEDRFDSKSVIAKTVFSAISTGTELAAWSGKPPLRPSVVYPRLVGYCNVAQVQCVGVEIDDLAEGDTILTHQSHCSNFVCDRQAVLLKLKKASSISQKRLAVSYLYHLGYSALLEGGYLPGFDVAIIGFGALGYASADLVSAYGGEPRIFTGRSNTVELTKHINFVNCFKKTDVETRNSSGSGLDGADLVVNTSDSWDDYELSLKLVRRGGTIVFLGFPGRGMGPPTFNPFDSKYIYDKLIKIRQAGHAPELDASPLDIRFTLKRNLVHLYYLLESGRLDPTPLLKTSFSWKNLQEAYQFLESRPNDVLSALLDWSC